MDESHVTLLVLIFCKFYIMYEVRSKTFDYAFGTDGSNRLLELFYNDFGLFSWILITSCLHFLFATVVPLTIGYIAITEHIGNIHIAYLSWAVSLIFIFNPLIRYLSPIKYSATTNSSIKIVLEILQAVYMAYLLLVISA